LYKWAGSEGNAGRFAVYTHLPQNSAPKSASTFSKSFALCSLPLPIWASAVILGSVLVSGLAAGSTSVFKSLKMSNSVFFCRERVAAIALRYGFCFDATKSSMRLCSVTKPYAPFLTDSSSNFSTPSGFWLGAQMAKGTGSLECVPSLIGVG
jgi:hypothetical protein